MGRWRSGGCPVRWIALGAGLLLSAACGGPEPKVEGRVASGGGYLGDWDLYPNHCAMSETGLVLDEQGFTKRKLRLIDRSRGTGTTLSKVEIHLDDETDDGPRDIMLTDATCVTGSFEASARSPSGDLHVDCQTGEGGHVIGSIKFANCR
jgi:hypothetical protein